MPRASVLIQRSLSTICVGQHRRWARAGALVVGLVISVGAVGTVCSAEEEDAEPSAAASAPASSAPASSASGAPGGAAASAGTGNPELPDRVPEWIRQLDAPTQAAREEAERQLIGVGPAVLSHLPIVTATTSAETKLRLARIQSELEKKYAASLAQGSTVSLSGKMKLSAALAQLQQQSGNEVVDFRPQFGQEMKDPEIDVDAVNFPYWRALDQILDAAELDLYNYAGEQRRLAFAERSGPRVARSAHATYQGMFRFEPVSVGAERDLRSPNNQGMRLSLEVMWEPKVLPLVISQPLADIEIQDPDGKVLPLVDAAGTLDIPVQSTIAGVTLDLPVSLPDRSVPRIGSLRARGRALVPGMTARFVFENLQQVGKGGVGAGVRQQKAGIAVTLESVRANEDAHEFRVRLALDNANPSLQSYLDWAVNNVAYLENAKGERIGEPSFEKYLERENVVGFAYLFPGDADLSQYRLIYETPSMILDVPFEFTLRDIDLP